MREIVLRPRTDRALANSRARVDPDRANGAAKKKRKSGGDCPGCGGDVLPPPEPSIPWDFRAYQAIGNAERLYTTTGAWAAFRFLSGTFAMWATRGTWWVWQFVRAVASGPVEERVTHERAATCQTCPAADFVRDEKTGTVHAYCGECPCPKWRPARLFSEELVNSLDSSTPRPVKIVPGFKVSRKWFNCPRGEHAGSVKFVALGKKG